jgi:hypothetical protein
MYYFLATDDCFFLILHEKMRILSIFCGWAWSSFTWKISITSIKTYNFLIINVPDNWGHIKWFSKICLEAFLELLWKKRQKLPFSKIMRLHIYVVVTDAKWESGNFLRIKRPTKSLEGPFSSAAAKKIWNKY